MFTLSNPDPDDDDKTECTFIISLAQKVLERRQEHAIGFRIYEVKYYLLRNTNSNFFYFSASLRDAKT